jgi:transglycosylase-like protein
MRRLLAALVLIVIAIASLLLFIWYTRFGRFQPYVDTTVAGLTPAEKNISPAAAHVFKKIDGPIMGYAVSRAFISQLSGTRLRSIEWNLRGMIWSLLLPRRLSNDQMLWLYAHFMAFEGGNGIVYGAQHYFGKTPAQLSETEALTLITIARSPRAYSPTRNPVRYRYMFNLNLSRLRTTG